MKCQNLLSNNSTKNFINLSSADLALRVVMMKVSYKACVRISFQLD